MKKTNEIISRNGMFICEASNMAYFPLAVSSASGAVITDVEGREYIDLLASAASVNIGHSHPRLLNVVKDQIDTLINYCSGYVHLEDKGRLAEKLAQITPGEFDKKVLFGLSGSDANDMMIKLARSYTGRKKIVTFTKSYHGATFGAASMSAYSVSMKSGIGSVLPDIHHTPYPDCYRCQFNQKSATCKLECLKQLEHAFDHYIPGLDVAAVVIEPIEGDGGIVVPPQKFMDALASLCRENGILLVSEEIQQGFGRSGKWFGIEHFGIVPDIMVMGKAISSGIPMSAIVARSEIMDAAVSPGYNFTTAGNPVSCRAALETIKIIEEESLLERSSELGEYFKEGFIKLQEEYELIGDIRGMGLNLGIDLVEDRMTKEKAETAAAKICYRCYENGVLMTYLDRNVLRIQPPLAIEKEQIDKSLEVIAEAFQDYVQGRIPDEVISMIKGWG